VGTSRFVGSMVFLCLVAGLALPSIAGASTTQMTVPINETDPDACTGEPVLVTGEGHITMISSGSKSEVQTNWQNVSGIGTVTGTRYQANDAQHVYFMNAPGNTTFSFHDSYELVSLNNTSNFLVHAFVTIDLSTGSIRVQNTTTCSGSTPP
jgi:hypothetical protein